MDAAASALRTVQIERASGLTAEVFHQRYLSGSGTPVVVTDALDHWAARTKWTFEFFKSNYGSESVTPHAGPRSLRLMRLADFIDYVEAPDQKARGFWLDPATGAPVVSAPAGARDPLYLAWNVFAAHPELRADVQLSPGFIEDWLPYLPEPFHLVLDSLKNYFSAGVLIGPKGATSRMHRDILHTHAYLAHLAGHKQCLLLPPQCAGLAGQVIDRGNPDFVCLPGLAEATAFECTLSPGELLFIPSRWWHQVISLEKTITVNYNFFNRANFAGYLTDILQDLPAVIATLEKLPEAKKAMGIDWVSRGFESL